MVWYSFYSRSTGYWFAAQEYISSIRTEDPTIWMDFEYLINTVTKIERRKNKTSKQEIELSEDEIASFLKEECLATGCNIVQLVSAAER